MKTWTLSAMVALSALLAGCEVFRPEMGNPSQVQDRSFDDIPIPNEFVLDRDSRDGYSYDTGSYRAGLLIYKGNARAADVARFYRHSMVLSGWSPGTETPDAELDEESSDLSLLKRLTFEKGVFKAAIAVGETRHSRPERPESKVIIKLRTH